MVKIATFFLIGMAVLALFGRLRIPGLGKRGGRRALPKPSRCRRCGRIEPGGGPCTVCNGDGS
ncbi:hypothetical protein HKCCE2091_00910 [Rhodobacterales bacterium HKCCE2091]|nr:hypothetical protein [Rhodobacterales bacterium HKCCE2091]